MFKNNNFYIFHDDKYKRGKVTFFVHDLQQNLTG